MTISHGMMMTRGKGTFRKILAHFKDLKVRGPLQGYFPELTKRILVVALQNVDRVKELFHGMLMTVVTISRYLGGFIGDRYTETTHLYENVQGWAYLARTLSGVARKLPQTDYAELQRSLQKEWEFV